jgi:hypothetical protein
MASSIQCYVLGTAPSAWFTAAMAVCSVAATQQDAVATYTAAITNNAAHATVAVADSIAIHAGRQSVTAASTVLQQHCSPHGRIRLIPLSSHCCCCARPTEVL